MRKQPITVVVLEEETGTEYTFVALDDDVLEARIDAFLLHGEPTWVARNP